MPGAVQQSEGLHDLVSGHLQKIELSSAQPRPRSTTEPLQLRHGVSLALSTNADQMTTIATT